MNRIEETSSDSYIEAELAKIEEANKQESIFVEQVNKNPIISEENKLTDEEKEAYIQEMINNNNISGDVKINEYMLEISESEVIRNKEHIKMDLENGYLTGAFDTANMMLETYNLNNYTEYRTFFENVSFMDFLILDNFAPQIGMSFITDIELFCHAFARCDKYTQAELIIFKDSEILPSSNKVKVISIEDCSPRTEMNAAVTMRSIKGYHGYKAIVDIDGVEYAFYILKNTSYGNMSMFKTLLATEDPKAYSKNPYSIYTSISSIEDEATYGTPVKGGS